ncbi:unnamed protein product [Symbiodinium sp. CCMP2592]|nr:unnamed protein product [Symbiodinium sp. CCMP2592]
MACSWLHCQPLEMKILGAAAMATNSGEMPCLEVAADAHSSAFARASARTSETLQSPLRLAVYGEGLVAAQAASALATGLASAIAAAGQAAEVSVCLFHGLTAAELLADADSQTLRDLRGRRGPGLRQLLSQQRPEVLFLVAGSCDLGLRDASPDEAMGSLHGLVRKAQASTPLVFVMALPDISKSTQCASLLGATLAARRHATNAGLVQWIDNSTAKWINPAALLPHGPRSVAAGCWDSHLLSENGARILAERLVLSVLPRIRATLEHGGASQVTTETQLPSLDAFMEAFRLEDDAEADDANVQDFKPPSPAWEADAAIVLQRGLRRVCTWGSRSYRLALARLAVRQCLSKAHSATLRPVVSSWGVRLTAA